MDGSLADLFLIRSCPRLLDGCMHGRGVFHCEVAWEALARRLSCCYCSGIARTIFLQSRSYFLHPAVEKY